MKIARQDDRNKVRLERDKLDMNYTQYIPPEPDDSANETVRDKKQQTENDIGARPKQYSDRNRPRGT